MEMSKVDQSYNVPEAFNEQYPPLSHPSFYQIESYIQQLEEQIIPTQDHILMDNEKIRDELGTLSGSLASLELKQNYSFMTESLKTKEEIQSLRSMYQSLARQLQFLLAEKSNRITNPRAGFSTRTRPNPGSSTSNGEGHSRAFKDMAEKTKL
ncbi:hypothetical protein K7432_017852 [Basidiobolus ranarum]|uniref:Uncharacterized protein n=1 Tax=Basidiobolus ranarum TaxID=34480 RepID=A0ABR2WCV3_9FUNG